MADWHGWSRVGKNGSLHVGHVPTRKSVALYWDEGATCEVLAYFRDEAAALRCMEILDRLILEEKP